MTPDPAALLDNLPPVRTQAQLCAHWRLLMGPLGFTDRSLWMAFFAHDGTVVPIIPQVEGIPERAEAEAADRVISFALELARDSGSAEVALLISRPGAGALTSSDRAWASLFLTSAVEHGLRLRPVHVATPVDIVVVAGDDLADAV